MDHLSYLLTASLFEDCQDPDEFRFLYGMSQRQDFYSAKSQQPLPFPRTCRLCRHTIIRAYYQEAVRRGLDLIFLGMNEWTGLSGDKVESIRTLRPEPHLPKVDVVHLPFLFRRTLAETSSLLDMLNWKPPTGENLVESNANSCLLARAAEEKAKALLGFHPDTVRLAREVTSGYLPRSVAREALEKPHTASMTVRETLEKAGIIR